MQLCLFVVCLALCACDNEIDFAAPWRDIPIVHGILSVSDTAHYIRVERAFLDTEVSPLQIARIPDSIYYSVINVSLVNVANEQRFQLHEVRAELEGYPRDQGIFIEEPNMLYKVLAEDLNAVPGAEYRLEITRTDDLPVVFAQTRVLAAPNVNSPREGQLLRFSYEREFEVIWQEVANATIYDVYFDVHVIEHLGDGTDRSAVVHWVVTSNDLETEAAVLGIQFYETLADRLEADPMIERTFLSMDLTVLTGGRELFEFQQIFQANTGITSAGGEVPTYTNISGGAGVFSSTNRRLIPNFDLHPVTMDSLRNGGITGDLNFR